MIHGKSLINKSNYYLHVNLESFFFRLTLYILLQNNIINFFVRLKAITNFFFEFT